ncbi:C2 NT-type domain-containing protein [Mycena kentingensis (nom. inval.)]|nr:C2 NT-type domain-containing protein [Mycena kentingensis (nom. inval.)]
MAARERDDDRPTGLKAQLHNLLPRHATFRVRTQIHHLASVPLVSGEFAVRWKFKNTQRVKKPRTGDEETLQVPAHAQAASSSSSLDEGEPSSSDDSKPADIFSSDDETTSARGQTAWAPLKDHSVNWEHTLSVFAQMNIDRDSHHLLPHPFKLSIVQRVVPGDPNAPRNPRLGAVDIDLAAYTDSAPLPASDPPKGVVNRRYLLRDSKTNATLRLSISIETVGTPPPFIAPPLPNGEILAGVTSLLSTHSEVFNTRPRALDLYAPAEGDGLHSLTLGYGPKTTESLIDAIFNPAPVREQHLVGPFTRLVPPGSPYPSSSSASSFRTLSSDDSSSFLSPSPVVASSQSLSPPHANERAPRWWQRNRSRSRSRSRSRVRSPQITVSA